MSSKRVRAHIDRLNKMSAYIERINEVFDRDAKAIDDWYHRPRVALDGRTPDVAVGEGDGEKVLVLALVDRAARDFERANCRSMTTEELVAATLDAMKEAGSP